MEKLPFLENRQLNRYFAISGLKGDGLVRAIANTQEILDGINVEGMGMGEAGLKLDRALKQEFGYKYLDKAFKAGDVLGKRGGNCLGLPILVAGLLAKKWYDPSDATRDSEINYHETLKDSIPYSASAAHLAREKSEGGLCKFASKQHLTVDLDGLLLETTDNDGGKTFSGSFETIKPVGFDEAFALLYSEVMHEQDANGEQADLKHLKAGRGIWAQCPNLHFDGARFAMLNFDDEEYSRSRNEYLKLNHANSLWNHQAYLLSGDETYLDESLRIYPSNVPAIAAKAKAIAGRDPGEARTQMAIASRMAASSYLVDLWQFYVNNAMALSKLFGKENVLDILNSSEARKEKTGNFDYHIQKYLLSGNIEDLAEADEPAVYPHQRLTLYTLAKDGPLAGAFDAERKLSEMDKAYANSACYSAAKEDLNKGRRL